MGSILGIGENKIEGGSEKIFIKRNCKIVLDVGGCCYI